MDGLIVCCSDNRSCEVTAKQNAAEGQKGKLDNCSCFLCLNGKNHHIAVGGCLTLNNI